MCQRAVIMSQHIQYVYERDIVRGMNAFVVVGVIAAALAAGCANNRVPVEIAAQPAHAPRSTQGITDYPVALDAIVDAFEQLGLPRVDVRLILFPDRRSFEQGLLESGYTPALARSASSFSAIGGARAVLVNAGEVERLDRTRRIQLVAHELVHSLQYRFGNGTRGASEQWLREGFAEWVSYRVADHLGLASFDALRDDLLGALTNAPFGLQPAPFDRLVTFPQWVEAQRRYDVPLYTQAFVAVDLLIELHDVPTVVHYFEQFKATDDYQRAFADAFGAERAAFDRMFARRWQETVTKYRMRR
jgi:hypothetical protein